MSKRAEDFMDRWLDAKVSDRHIKAPDRSAPILAKKCATDAKKAGVPIEELEEVVVDLEQAITDELTVAASKGNTAWATRDWPLFANGRKSIYRPRVLDERKRFTRALAETFRKHATSAQVELDEVEEEVGALEKGQELVAERQSETSEVLASDNQREVDPPGETVWRLG